MNIGDEKIMFLKFFYWIFIFEFILISAAITLPGTCLGKLTGFAINPARDFAPRIFSAIVFGSGALSVYKKCS